MKTKLTPIGDRLLIQPLKPEEISKGGILIPQAAQEKPQQGQRNSHPWTKQFNASLKLSNARKIYKRRYERGETKYGDKHKEITRELTRTRYRIKKGLDLESAPYHAKRIPHSDDHFPQSD